MSIVNSVYLVYGYKLSTSEDFAKFDEHYEELMEDYPYWEMFNNTKSEQTIVCDCMWGAYIYVGVKVAHVDEYDDKDGTELDADSFNTVGARLKAYMQKWPGYLLDLVKGKTPKLHFFVHAC